MNLSRILQDKNELHLIEFAVKFTHGNAFWIESEAVHLNISGFFQSKSWKEFISRIPLRFARTIDKQYSIKDDVHMNSRLYEI